MIVIYMTHKPGDGLDHHAHEQKWSLTSGPLIMLMIKMIINIIVKMIFDHAHDDDDDNYKSFYSRWCWQRLMIIMMMMLWCYDDMMTILREPVKNVLADFAR